MIANNLTGKGPVGSRLSSEYCSALLPDLRSDRASVPFLGPVSQLTLTFGTHFAYSTQRRRNVRVENQVLLVEGDAPLRRSLENYLERAGYAFHSCATAREALTLAERHQHTIAIVGYHLPDANGAGLLEKLIGVVPKLATIILSEYDFQAVAEEMVRVKVDSFLKKPFDLVDLEAALDSAGSRAGKSKENLQWEPEVDSKGVPASIYK